MRGARPGSRLTPEPESPFAPPTVLTAVLATGQALRSAHPRCQGAFQGVRGRKLASLQDGRGLSQYSRQPTTLITHARRRQMHRPSTHHRTLPGDWIGGRCIAGLSSEDSTARNGIWTFQPENPTWRGTDFLVTVRRPTADDGRKRRLRLFSPSSGMFHMVSTVAQFVRYDRGMHTGCTPAVATALRVTRVCRTFVFARPHGQRSAVAYMLLEPQPPVELFHMDIITGRKLHG